MEANANILNGKMLTSLGYTNWNSDNFPIKEGVWTPKLTGMSIPGNHVYTNQIGKFWRFEKLVFVRCYLVTSTLDETISGILQITGFPFAASADSVFAMNPTDLRGISVPDNYTLEINHVGVAATLQRSFIGATNQARANITASDLQGPRIDVGFTGYYIMN